MQQSIQLNIPNGAVTIDGYGTDGFTVKEQLIASDLLIYQDRFEELDFQGFAKDRTPSISIEDFAMIFALEQKPDLVLLGTGTTHQFVPPSVRAHFTAQGIALETMDTGAACRTYNILLAEGRLVTGLMLKP